MLQFDPTINTDGTYMLGYLFVCEEELPSVKKYGKLYKHKYDARIYNNSNIFWFEQVVGRLYNVSGQEIFEQGDEYKLSFEVIGSYNGKPFTLYDWKGDKCVHIGGKDDLDVIGLRKELSTLLKNTKEKPFTAKLHYDHCIGCSYSYPMNDNDDNDNDELA